MVHALHFEIMHEHSAALNALVVHMRYFRIACACTATRASHVRTGSGLFQLFSWDF